MTVKVVESGRPLSGPQLTEAAGRLGVLMGGDSNEREISLQSGRAVLNGLLKRGFNAIAVDLKSQPVQAILESKIDTAFIALHGVGGEDGQVQAILDALGIVYTGSDMASSALAMDKAKTKYVWQAMGLPTARFEMLHGKTDWHGVGDRLGYPIMVKPANGGSSLDMSVARSPQEIKEAYELASGSADQVLAEAWLAGREFTVPVLDNRALPVIELQTAAEFYDYNAKYVSGQTRYLCPAPLDTGLAQQLKTLSLDAFNSLGCRHWGRVDLMMNAAGEVMLLEINTAPGMTEHSLVPKSAASEGTRFDQLVEQIVAVALMDEQKRRVSA